MSVPRVKKTSRTAGRSLMAPPATLKHLEAALRRRGARPTRQRRVVYAALAERFDHPTAEAIHRVALRRSPGMSLATVYTTLDLLVESGLAARVPGPDGAARYDARTDRHDHRRCLTCGRIDDVERAFEPRLDPYHRPDFHAVDLRLEIVGYCSGCQDAAGAPRGPDLTEGPHSHSHEQGDPR